MPAVFVHGVPDTHRVWDEVLPLLDRSDVVALDLPGFAVEPGPAEPTKEFYATWLTAQLEAVGEPVDLVGHDWGGMLCVRVASARPDLVRTLTFGGSPVDEAYVWHPAAQLWQTPEVGEQVMAGTTPETMAPALETQGLTPAQAAACAAGIHDEMKRCILALYRSAVHVGDEWAPGLDGFDRPALALFGAGDLAVPTEVGERMSARMGGRLVVLDCGHWWPLERPAEVAAELTRLWRG